MNSKLLLLLTVLPLSLAVFAFVLQWRGEIDDDPTTRWARPNDRIQFPGMESSSEHVTRSTGSSCVDLLGQSKSLSFPYFRDWKFDLKSDLKPK
ncbi:hypothetical protein Tco_1340832, partial [Tanacetum coccineum]